MSFLSHNSIFIEYLRLCMTLSSHTTFVDFVLIAVVVSNVGSTLVGDVSCVLRFCCLHAFPFLITYLHVDV